MYLLGDVAGMKIERITLRQIRMPLVHFFETSFGRTYERQIVLVEVISGGVSGWGEVTGRREPVLQRGVDRIGLADSARLRRRRAVLAKRAGAAADVGAADGAHPRPPAWRAAAWRPRCGTWQARLDGVPLWQQIGGGARRRFPAASRSAFRIRSSN